MNSLDLLIELQKLVLMYVLFITCPLFEASISIFRIELILLSGDLATMPMEYGLDPSEEAEIFNPSYYEDFEKVVEAVSRINSNVYYIPGNVRITSIIIITCHCLRLRYFHTDDYWLLPVV